MANTKQLALLKSNVTEWNEFLRVSQEDDINLSEGDLNGANLSGADLRYSNMRYAKLRHANLSGA